MLYIEDNYIDSNSLNQIRSMCLQEKYRDSNLSIDGWSGHRTNPLWLVNKKIYDNLTHKVYKTFCEQTGLSNQGFVVDSFLHYSTEATKNDLQNFESDKFHTDTTQYAGVIYLTPNPPRPKETGTIVGDTIVENVYNRLVMYDANIEHAPGDVFGSNIENGRMTFTFFIDKGAEKTCEHWNHYDFEFLQERWMKLFC